MDRNAYLLWGLWLILLGCWAGCSCQDTARTGEEPAAEAQFERTTDAAFQEPEPASEPDATPEPASEPDVAPEPTPEPDGGSETTPEPGKTSRCEATATTLTCEHNAAILDMGAFVPPRVVYWQKPLGEPPEGGWPVALMFQGSLFSSKLNWYGVKGAPFGTYHQTATLKGLLDAGYTVLTPVAKGAGTTFWDTNIPPYAAAWSLAPDHQMMKKIFEDLEQGVFGKVNTKRLYALGISSGGYMTSRMAVAYQGRFRALAIHSASYANCAGSVCYVPSLPKDHPPTLFLHGLLDPIVPIATMYLYRNELKDMGIPYDVEVQDLAAHEWISTAPQKILSWFRKHP